jgi:hypothetical protein
LSRQILTFVLEFDLETPAATFPSPCFFVALDGRCVIEPESLLGIVQDQLKSTPLASLQPELEKCLGQLLPGAYISHVGAMMSRHDPVVRLNVAGTRPENLSTYLRAIGWNGDFQSLESTLAEISPWTDSLNLALDVSAAGAMDRIGFECFLNCQPADEPRWTCLLDYLVKKDLCAPEKAEALAQWHGIDRRETSAAWPPALAVADHFLKSRALSFFMRRLNHVKVIFASGALREAKAYLLFEHQWIDRRALNGIS